MENEKQEEVVEQKVTETKAEEVKVEEPKAEKPKKESNIQDDGSYKLNLSQTNKNEKDALRKEIKNDEKSNEEKIVKEEKNEEVKTSIIEEVTDEEVVETTEETTNTGGSASAKYMTRPVILTNDATALDIRVSANVRSTSTVKLYYRVTSAEDARKLGDVAWRGFNDDGTSDAAVDPAKDDFTFKELKFSASDLPEFTAFQLKVVLTGTNSSYPPILRDMRGIALAV